MMYAKIEKMVPVYQKYTNKLLADGVITKEQKEALEKHHTDQLTHAYMTSKEESFDILDWKARPWEAVSNPISKASIQQQ